jgi:ATP-dependent DNA helicase RecG
MPLKLSSPITEAPRIGPAKTKFLEKLNIRHVRDLLYTFPRRYDDFSQTTFMKDLKVGEKMTVRGKVTSVKSDWGFRGRQRLLRIFVELADHTGTLSVTWYNLRFLPKQLWQGRELYVAGVVEESHLKKKTPHSQYAMRSPVIEFADSRQEQTHTGRITPVYPETYGVTSRFLRYQVKQLLPLIDSLPEYIPADIRKRHNLIGIREAIRIVHFPDNTEQLKEAQRRLRFDELFFLQLAALVRRQHLKQHQAFSIKNEAAKLKKFIQKFPFTLTAAQEKALQEILNDLYKTVPMNRLLQGDVGSGKSAVALLATYTTLQAGYKVLYLAPTEILARQQAQYFALTLGQEKARLLIGALSKQAKETIKRELQQTEVVCVVGTHALLQGDVAASQVGLVIIDEQHRFGVAQRHTLQEGHQEIRPHLLSMTATPIPRTLNLTVYGDLDISILDELPPGRKPVKTSIIAPDKREQAIIHTLEELHRGRQGYVITPLVEESEKLQVKSAKETYEEMKKLFPGIAISLVHGQLPSEEKETIMRNFAAGAIQLLVSTAVVEVGVNVPNATAMIIEGAERFGLAQLHQFRGRIGRGEYQSYCYLFPTTAAAASSRRLKILTETTDGFVIAEEDLRLRGPGEVYGVAQSGFGDLKVASLLDYPMIKATRQEAERLLQEDSELKDYPILKGKVEQKNLLAHFE